MRNAKWLTGICTVALLIAGCSSTPQRSDPYSLPQYAEPDGQCRDINGRYNALPHSVGKTQGDTRPLLALTLLPPQQSLAQSAKVVVDVGEDHSLQVMALGDDNKLLAKRRYDAGSGVFECKDSRLEFHPRKLAAGDSDGINWDTVVLRRTEDGSLFLRKGGLFSGLVFMVFPMYVSTEDWYQFKPVE